MSRRYQYVLGCLLAFLALNAFGGGYYGLAGAKGVPREWLARSPFDDYIVPSLILIFVVGGAFLGAAIAVFAALPAARRIVTLAGALALVWIAAQVAIIGPVSWLQPAIACVGVLLLVVARKLPLPAPS